ncbi:PAS domain-containing protein [Caenispirillum salinarum]|uniref:hybrid sensor histidine kinase/response regulator n=1 Tax=Caenispirillum salinarum TaxID=859058 RepID=UPI0038508A9C
MPSEPAAFDASAHLRRLLDSTADGILHVDRNGRVTFANAAAEDLSAGAGTAVGRSLAAAFGADFGTALRHLCRRVRETGTAQAADLEHAPTATSWSARAFPFDDGASLFLRSLGDGALPTAAERRAMAERQLEALFEHAPVGFAYFDHAGGFARVNRWMAEINGLPVEEHIGRRIGDLLPDVAPHVMPVIAQIFATGVAPAPFEIYAETLKPPGSKRHFRTGWFPVTDDTGRVVHAGTVVTEITDLRRAEQESDRLTAELDRERRLLRAIIEQMPAGVIVAEAPSGKVILHNSEAERLLGHPVTPTADVSAYGEYGGLHEDGRSYAADEYPLARPLITGDPTPLTEMRYRRGDGRLTTFMVNAAPVFAPDGRMILSACTFYDISHRAEMERELRRAKEEAERADHAKSRFLAAASHDLRQPMQSLFFFTESLRPHLKDTEGADRLGHLTNALDALKGLLDSMLDVSRLDANMVEPRLERFPLAPVLEDLRTAYEGRALEEGLTFRVAECTAWTRTDRTLLGRILRNLVENALRYTPEGEIVVNCRPVPERKAARIEVRDTGIGIPAEHLERVWDEFHQVGNPERDREQGLGLGLAIVRRLSMLLDLPVDVESRVGGGSVFSVETPLAEPDHAAEAADVGAAPPAADGRRAAAETLVLVIDDDAIVLMGTEGQLQDWGYQTLGAASGAEAARLLRADGRCPDLILADYRLRAGETGTDAVARVRGLCGQVPTLVLTGETSPETQRTITGLGLGLLHKPVTPGQLRRALDDILARGGG